MSWEGVTIAAIIPALNEAEAIAQVIADIPDWVDQIVVVDNGSTDGTPEIAARAGAIVLHESQRGYGYACYQGMVHVRDWAKIVVFLDGDYSDHPEEMDRLLRPLLADEAELVIGSRLAGDREPGAIPAHAVWGNRLFSTILSALYPMSVTDLGPFRAMRTEDLFALDLTEFTYGWTLEMMIKAARKGMRVIEVPVSYRARNGQSKVSGSLSGSIRAALRMFSTLRHCFIRSE